MARENLTFLSPNRRSAISAATWVELYGKSQSEFFVIKIFRYASHLLAGTQLFHKILACTNVFAVRHAVKIIEKMQPVVKTI